MKKIIPLFLSLLLMAMVSQAQTQKMKTWKGVPYRVSGTMLKGDANGDGLINMTDVTIVINYILGRNIDDFSFENAELTGDGFINMSDVTAIINIILGRNADKKPQAYLTCPDDNHPHIIDLGLPSGTKWACCNVGATVPDELGGRFAWGAIEETDEPYQPSEEGEDGVVESICGTEHDVAHVKWGGAWQMPSVEQIRELCDYSKVFNDYIIWNEDETEHYYIEELTYSNGGKITIPYEIGEIVPHTEPDLDFFYWSGTACTSEELSGGWYDIGEKKYAWGLSFWDSPIVVDPGSVHVYDNYKNFDVSPLPLGELASVRPIYSGDSYGYLTLSTNVVNIGVGDSYDVNILSGTGNYRFINTSSSIAEVTFLGTTISITGKSEGTATVTVTDFASGMSLEISVLVKNYCPDSNHPHVIDLGLPSGTKWACCNVGADKPESKGNKYEWGRTEESTDSLSYGYPDYEYINSILEEIGKEGDISGTKYDVAHVKWGDSWCMPSSNLAWELIGHCSYEVLTRNGEKGMAFTGPSGETLFLPYADFIFYVPDMYAYRENCGVYWLSGEGGSNYLLCSSEGETDLLYYTIPGPSYVRPVIEGHNLSVSTSEMDLYYGESDMVFILVGSGNYTISCSDTNVADVLLDGSEITITGKAVGKATVTVTDMTSGITTDIIVTVSYKDLKLERNNVTMYYGEMTNVYINSGNGEYSVSNSSPGVIDVSLDGSTITIEAKATGNATVMVTDTTSGMTAFIIVTVTYADLKLERNNVTMYYGETTKVDIVSGNGEYSVSNSSPGVIDVSLDGSTITIEAKATGKATLTVKDLVTGMTTEIVVTVTYKDLLLSVNEIDLLTGETTRVRITSGNGTYSASCSDPSIVDVRIRNSYVLITGEESGTTTITVYDEISGMTADINVTVSD